MLASPIDEVNDACPKLSATRSNAVVIVVVVKESFVL